MNPFSVGQEYSGYYMDGQSCPESGHANQYHIFNDTRLDSTGPDGRIKDRTLIGDMERGREAGLDKEKQTVDIEDYSHDNIQKQTDFPAVLAEYPNHSENLMHGLREAKKVFYADLDINGNSHPGYLEGEDDGNKLFGPNSFVSNTMKIYVKNPNIMLDKRVSVNSAEARTW